MDAAEANWTFPSSQGYVVHSLHHRELPSTEPSGAMKSNPAIQAAIDLTAGAAGKPPPPPMPRFLK